MAEKRLTIRILNVALVILSGIMIILSVWQPVLPSRLIIGKMVESVFPENISAVQPAVIRFDLEGKGGGVYSVVAENNSVKMVKGETDRADLIICMKAVEFNHMILSMASGKTDDSVALRMILSNILRFAGDMNIFKTLFENKETAHDER